MNAEKPLYVIGRDLHPHESIGRGQPDALADRLERKGERPEPGKPRMTKWGFQVLLEQADLLASLVRLAQVDPERVEAELARLLAELKPLLPLFAERLTRTGWKVIEDLGSPLPDDWDPRPYLEGQKVDCVHPDGQEYMKGDDLVTEARARLVDRGGFSQHELCWFFRHWADERIPDWFRQAVESGEIYLIATETILLGPDGYRYVLCLYWSDGRLGWVCSGFDDGRWHRDLQVLVPGDSFV
ncbi:MAG: hypothetical protein Q7S64_03335 [bacterium]|nr:hypothetical protein [bacterium]